MNTTISPKITTLTFGVLAISFLAAFYVVAWQEPTSAPPAGNVSTPLNVGPAGQSKEGGLILNTSGAPNGLIVDKGNVGIGVASAGAKLEVADNIIASVPTVSGHVATKGYVDAQTGASGKIRYVKMTSATYNGNLGGYAGANAKCVAQYPDYRMCNYDELVRAGAPEMVGGLSYGYDFANVQFDTQGWAAPDISAAAASAATADCGAWINSAAPYGIVMGLSRSSAESMWAYRWYGSMTTNNCAVARPIWCCPW